MRSKRGKVLAILGLLVVAAVCLPLLWPRDEPKYQGRYLSEWMEIYHSDTSSRPSPEDGTPEEAFQAIGTNGIPCYLKWTNLEDAPARKRIYLSLPEWIRKNRVFEDWYYGPGNRAQHGMAGFRLLGSDAVTAIPELRRRMRDPVAPRRAMYAIYALSSIGADAIPVFEEAMADPQQSQRDQIIMAVGFMVPQVGTNACLSILGSALTNEDRRVRRQATNVFVDIAERFSTDTPTQ